jgi:hypothetical protein
MLRVTFNLDPSAHGSDRDNRPIELPDEEKSSKEEEASVLTKPKESQPKKKKHFAIRSSELLKQLEQSNKVEKREKAKEQKEVPRETPKPSETIPSDLVSSVISNKVLPVQTSNTRTSYSLKAVLANLKTFFSFNNNQENRSMPSQD